MQMQGDMNQGAAGYGRSNKRQPPVTLPLPRSSSLSLNTKLTNSAIRMRWELNLKSGFTFFRVVFIRLLKMITRWVGHVREDPEFDGVPRLTRDTAAGSGVLLSCWLMVALSSPMCVSRITTSLVLKMCPESSGCKNTAEFCVSFRARSANFCEVG